MELRVGRKETKKGDRENEEEEREMENYFGGDRSIIIRS